jgi:hypothetical protein
LHTGILAQAVTVALAYALSFVGATLITVEAARRDARMSSPADETGAVLAGET